MGSILNERDRTEIETRLRSLSVSSTRRWGSMDVANMLHHLHLSARMTLGDLPVVSVNKRAFQKFPLKHLLMYVLPFPKGAPTATELKPSAAVAFEEERAALLELLERRRARSPAVWANDVARVGRGYVQTRGPSSKTVRGLESFSETITETIRSDDKEHLELLLTILIDSEISRLFL